MPFLLNLLFTSTTWLWLLLSVITGIAYAFIFYPKALSEKTLISKCLFVFRAISVATLIFLLFAPLTETIKRETEKPLIIFAQDNSSSIRISKPAGFDLSAYKKNLHQLISQLKEKYDVKSFQFGTAVNEKNVDDSKYTDDGTDIAALFKQLNNQYQGRNIGAVILASDGIYNSGGSPAFEANKIKSPIYAIALGDTSAKKDVLITNVQYNDVVFLNNQFQLKVNFEAYLLKGSNAKLTVKQDSKVVASRSISINSNDFQGSALIALDANKKGQQKYLVSIEPLSGELSKENNSQGIFVDVIDGRKDVLIIANSPHPDLSALKSSIEESKNYTVKVVMASEIKNSELQRASLIIMHQLPSITNQAKNILTQLQNKSIFFIIGNQTDVSAFSGSQSVLNISSQANTLQETFGAVNENFYSFSISDSTINKIRNFPPLLSPFGNYAVKSTAAVFMNQRIANIKTEKPLFLFADEGQRKIGILAGEGIWRWKLDDFEENGNHTAVNELVTKTVQFLSTNTDKRKFRVFSAKNNFLNNEPVLFNAELYNDAFELINSPEVNITLTSNKGKKYSYLFSRTEKAYELNAGALPEGEYSYSAATKLGDKNYSLSGKINVIKQKVEILQTVANHQLLSNMAIANGGSLIYPNEINKLPELLQKNELVKTVSHEDKQYDELINIKVLFFLIIALLTAEWFIRKRNGEI